MTGSVAASDDFYVVFQGKAIQTATHPSDRALTATDGTFTSNVSVTGNVTADGLRLGDSDYAAFGDGLDLQSSTTVATVSSLTLEMVIYTSVVTTRCLYRMLMALRTKRSLSLMVQSI